MPRASTTRPTSTRTTTSTRLVFSIDTLELTQGELPRRQIRLVQAWAELHRDELVANWQMVTNGEEPCRIPPLQ